MVVIALIMIVFSVIGITIIIFGIKNDFDPFLIVIGIMLQVVAFWFIPCEITYESKEPNEPIAIEQVLRSNDYVSWKVKGDDTVYSSTDAKKVNNHFTVEKKFKRDFYGNVDFTLVYKFQDPVKR